MDVKIFHCNEDEMKKLGNEVKYWSNGLGELHICGVSISEDELPPELQRAYNDLWTDEFGSFCYLVETPRGYGVALLNEYDECFADDCNLTMDKLFESVLKDSEQVSGYPEFQHTDIYVGEYSGFNECHELIVVFPATTPVEEFKAAAALLDELVYESAKHINPSLESQIHSASTRAAETHPTDNSPKKETIHEH